MPTRAASDVLAPAACGSLSHSMITRLVAIARAARQAYTKRGVQLQDLVKLLYYREWALGESKRDLNRARVLAQLFGDTQVIDASAHTNDCCERTHVRDTLRATGSAHILILWVAIGVM